MDYYFEIAFASVSNRLCLFTGTGFSKAVSSNLAPSWQGLLESLCQNILTGVELSQLLFPTSEKHPLTLEESAQIIGIEYAKQGLSIHDKAASYFTSLTPSGNVANIQAFFQNNKFRVVTTNYDKLAETLSTTPRTQSISPGMPIPKSSADVKVFHLHGSIDFPEQMVLTSDDYFKFTDHESYFSRKLSTILYENTVVIMGYSLGDNNLKNILNEYKLFSKQQSVGSTIFFISRTKVNDHFKAYYSHCYGIRVIDEIEIDSFFLNLNTSIVTAKTTYDSCLTNIRSVVGGSHVFNDNYLKVDLSFYQIIPSLFAVGYKINEPTVVSLLGSIVDRKVVFTHANLAWGQYESLAGWLVYLCALLDLATASIQPNILLAIEHSMNTMRKDQYLGYSWGAYKKWDSGWSSILPSNKLLIRSHIQQHSVDSDVLELVLR